MITDFIIDTLKNDSSVTSVLPGKNIFPLVVPENGQNPCARVWVSNDTPIIAKDRNVENNVYALNIDIYVGYRDYQTQSLNTQIADAVIKALDYKTPGTYGTVNLDLLWYTGYGESFETDARGENNYVTSLTFSVKTKRA